MNNTTVLIQEPGLVHRNKSKKEDVVSIEVDSESIASKAKLSFWDKVRLMDNSTSFWTLFSLVLSIATPAIVIIILDSSSLPSLSDTTPVETLKDTRQQIVRFSIWLSFAWIAFLIIHFGLLVLPGIVVSVVIRMYGECSERVRNRLQYVPALGMFLPIALTTVVSVVIFRIVFFQLTYMTEWRDIFNAHLMVMVFSLMFLAQRIFVQKIAFDFHKVAYRDRLKQSKQALQVLENLRKAILKLSLFDFDSHSDESGDSNNILKIPEPVSDDDEPTLNQTPKRMTPINVVPGVADHLNGATLQVPGTRVVAREQTKVALDIGTSQKHKPGFTTNLASDSYALRLADKLFESLQKKDGEINVDEFIPFFDTREEAEQAFALFDKDGNGSVNLNELRWAIMRIYREKRSLAASMVDLSHALGNLNRILYAITIVSSILVSFPIYGISINAILPFTSILVALSFIFGSSAKAAFDCIVFLFVIHPFDSGDRIIVDGTSYVVDELSILTTVLTSDGKRIFYPNTVLSQKTIINVRRSSDMTDYVEVKVDVSTPESTMRQLHNRMLDYAKSNGRGYRPSCSMNITEMSTNLMTVQFSIDLKGNWQDGSRRSANKTAFLFTLKQNMLELGIKYELPPQKLIKIN